MHPCKGCGRKVDIKLDEKEINDIIEMLVRKGEEVVSDIMYQARLNTCLSCENLLYDTTCSLCGCFIHIKAKLKEQVCPHLQGNRWTKTN